MVGVTHEESKVSGWGTNLSQGVGFVNSSRAPPKGTIVSVILQLPGVTDCKLVGRVAWTQPAGPGGDGAGMRIAFRQAGT